MSLFGDAGLRDRLGSIARGRRLGLAGDAAPEPRPEGGGARTGRRRRARPDGVGVEEYLPGGEWRDGRGAVYVHERLRSSMERPDPRWGVLGEASEEETDLAGLAACGLESALFLDLETGGLASSPVFLAGTMHWNGSDYVLRQYFARHYGEEATLLGALAEATRGFEYLVTFNGKSYDAPFLLTRACIHAVPMRLPSRHLDLLHPARRRWKEQLPDCRLQTLERYVCRRRRSGDVPGDEVPGLYHDFVRRGDPYRMVPVFHHNLLDVITMGDVLGALYRRRRRAAEEGEGLGSAGTGDGGVGDKAGAPEVDAPVAPEGAKAAPPELEIDAGTPLWMDFGQ